MIRLGFLVFLIIILVMMILKGIKIVHPGEVMIIERLGAYLGKLLPGLHFIIPIIDSTRTIPWQFIEKDKNGKSYCVTKNVNTIPLGENIFYFLKQPILTKDYSKIEIDILVYFTVEEPLALTYEISSLPRVFEEIISSALKNKDISEDIIQGIYSVTENKLWEILNEKAKKFGVKINKVELRNIK